MSSLLLSASPYKSDENTNKKRSSQIRRFIKAKPSNLSSIEQEPSDVSDTSNNEFLREGYENVTSGSNKGAASFDNLQTVNDNRNARINDILNKMTTSNPEDDNNSKMGNFKPLDHPSLNVKRDLTETDSSATEYIPKVPSFVNASNTLKSGSFSYGGAENNVPTATPIYSNYNQSYQVPQSIKTAPYMFSPKSAIGGGGQHVINDDKLMERINYMIHLLEEQRNEKTSNITEEFILYTFLGIFVIYIVDSFTRAGKYTR